MLLEKKYANSRNKQFKNWLKRLMRLLKHIVFVNEKENNDYKGETHVG